MVTVLALLTLTNIALGYGLAVYLNKKLGTLVFAIPKRKKALPQAAVEASASGKEVALATSQAPSLIAPTPETATSESAPLKSESEPSVSAQADVPAKEATEISAIEPVDEENVLAGIEQFRSQLAKMSVSPEPITEPEQDLVGAQS